MGEMYEYFQDFPEEDPANYVGGVFDPAGARRERERKKKLVQEQKALDDEIQGIIEKAKQSLAEQSKEQNK
jgi:N-acetylglucosamine kinase-like BadF-type ATPase